MTAVRWCLLGLLLAVAGVAGEASDTPLLLPPAWADRVVFYHSFEQGADKPEINLMAAEVRGEKTAPAVGFTGHGYQTPRPYEKKTPLTLLSPALSVHKPLTVMLWWRLDAPMKEDTCFQLLALRGTGWISSFVRGKGDWCGLREPTYISQLYNFAGISNHNNCWGGRAWFEPGAWHHVAITVANAREIGIYWDGQRRETIVAKGRVFREGEVAAADLGANWLFHPMTLDEVVVADRVLTAEEIAAYVLAVQALRQRELR